MNRLEELSKTYPLNVELMPEAEFVLLDYGSHNPLSDWAVSLPERVVRCRTSDPTYFDMSHAKNVAHRIGKGDVLVNLDSDLFLSREYIEAITEHFADDQDKLVCLKEPGSWWGLMAIGRRLFYSMGGYDESLVGWGYDDEDLRERVRTSGWPVIELDWKPVMIEQDAARKTANYKESTAPEESRYHNWKWSETNIVAGFLVANQHRPWGKAKVECNFIN